MLHIPAAWLRIQLTSVIASPFSGQGNDPNQCSECLVAWSC